LRRQSDVTVSASNSSSAGETHDLVLRIESAGEVPSADIAWREIEAAAGVGRGPVVNLASPMPRRPARRCGD
jgi:hypothetical protein